MKRLFAFALLIVVTLSTMTSFAFASEPDKTVIDLGDGFYLQEVTVQRFYSRAGDTAVGHTLAMSIMGQPISAAQHCGEFLTFLALPPRHWILPFLALAITEGSTQTAPVIVPAIQFLVPLISTTMVSKS